MTLIFSHAVKYITKDCKISQKKERWFFRFLPGNLFILVSGGDGLQANSEMLTIHSDSSITTTTTLSNSCTLPGPTPVAMLFPVAAVVAGNPMLCGGQLTTDCYIFDKWTSSWQTATPLDRLRTFATSVQMDGGEVWVVGGFEAKSVEGGTRRMRY